MPLCKKKGILWHCYLFCWLIQMSDKNKIIYKKKIGIKLVFFNTQVFLGFSQQWANRVLALNYISK